MCSELLVPNCHESMIEQRTSLRQTMHNITSVLSLTQASMFGLICYTRFGSSARHPAPAAEALRRLLRPATCRCASPRGASLLRLPDRHREHPQRDVQPAAGAVHQGRGPAGLPAARHPDSALHQEEGLLGVQVDPGRQQLRRAPSGIRLRRGHPLLRQVRPSSLKCPATSHVQPHPSCPLPAPA